MLVMEVLGEDPGEHEDPHSLCSPTAQPHHHHHYHHHHYAYHHQQQQSSTMQLPLLGDLQNLQKLPSLQNHRQQDDQGASKDLVTENGAPGLFPIKLPFRQPSPSPLAQPTPRGDGVTTPIGGDLQLLGSHAAAAGSCHSPAADPSSLDLALPEPQAMPLPAKQLLSPQQQHQAQAAPALAQPSPLVPRAPDLRAPSVLEQQMQEAAERLRGEGRFVKVRINVAPDAAAASAAAAAQHALSASWHAAGEGMAEDACSGGHQMPGSSSWHASATGLPLPAPGAGAAAGDAAAAAGAFGGPEGANSSSGSWLLQRLPFVRKGSSGSVGGGAPAAPAPQRLVELLLEVCAGAGVPLGVVPPQRHKRRMPSFEAIDILAGKFKVGSMPPAAEVGPPLLIPQGGSSSSSAGASPRAEDAAHAAAGERVAAAHLYNVKEEASVQHDDAQQQQKGQQQGGVQQQRQEEAGRQQEQQQGGQGELGQVQSAGGRSLFNWLLRRDTGGAANLQQQQQPSQLPDSQQASSEDAAAAEQRARKQQAAAAAVYGERWGHKARRLRRAAGARAEQRGWAVRALIVKSGDDCRQEALALQLIREFGMIWSGEGELCDLCDEGHGYVVCCLLHDLSGRLHG